MVSIDDQDIADVINEETKRGKSRAKISAVERKRKFKAAARMLADPGCTLRDYTAAIREIEPQEDSPEFAQAVNLWHKFRA